MSYATSTASPTSTRAPTSGTTPEEKEQISKPFSSATGDSIQLLSDQHTDPCSLMSLSRSYRTVCIRQWPFLSKLNMATAT
ncbi:hypothetical protein GOODEAATRI_019134 [Goodea atripinnis]|uniref:Uncharacterized protein n=1 Tax=Goodea atripinnis TaxID=208336 RepID=A0ABV0PZA5_9TELE